MPAPVVLLMVRMIQRLGNRWFVLAVERKITRTKTADIPIALDDKHDPRKKKQQASASANPDVLHVKECGSNSLISIGILNRKNVIVTFDIYKSLQIIHNSKIFATALPRGNIWKLRTQTASTLNSVISPKLDER